MHHKETSLFLRTFSNSKFWSGDTSPFALFLLPPPPPAMSVWSAGCSHLPSDQPCKTFSSFPFSRPFFCKLVRLLLPSPAAPPPPPPPTLRKGGEGSLALPRWQKESFLLHGLLPGPSFLAVGAAPGEGGRREGVTAWAAEERRCFPSLSSPLAFFFEKNCS